MQNRIPIPQIKWWADSPISKYSAIRAKRQLMSRNSVAAPSSTIRTSQFSASVAVRIGPAVFRLGRQEEASIGSLRRFAYGL